MKYIKLLVISFLCFNLSAQQNVWTLQQCVDYALENNLTVKRSELNLLGSEINWKQAQFSRLPNLNANGSYAFSWGRTIDPTTNLFVDNQRIASSNAGANSSVTLFNGMNITNNIKQNEFAYRSSEKALEDSKNNVILNVVTFYTNVLFTKELFENAKKQLESTSQQVELTEKRVEAGALPRANLLDLLAQKATNELNVVNRENDYNNARISLKQALQLPPEQQIDIVLPEVELDINPVMDISAIEIYNIALNSQPNVQSTAYNKQSAEYGVKSQRGTYYPTLSLNVGLSTQFSDAAQEVTARDVATFSDPVLTGGQEVTLLNSVTFDDGTGAQTINFPATQPTEFETIPFATQFDDQLRYFLSLNLSIPIFNRFAARNGVQRSKITLNQAEVTDKETRYQLWQTIEQAYNNVIASAKSYESSQKQVDAREESYRVIKQRYELGAVNYVDYQVAENDLFQAKSDLLRAKYDYIFRLKILDFYQGKPLDF